MKPEASTFERYEKKYLLEPWQAQSLQPWILEHFQPDRYPESVICNVYFDTPDYRLIRQSIEKPVYKEKLRLRAYEVPSEQTTVYIELKKKYKGVVYKRRIPMSYQQAVDYLIKGKRPQELSQVGHEIDWFLHYYEKLAPAVYISYDRKAYTAQEDAAIRLTLDSRIQYRRTKTELSQGIGGEYLLQPGQQLMELKVPYAIPVWISRKLDELQIYPHSFSKYGEIYQHILREERDTVLNSFICA